MSCVWVLVPLASASYVPNDFLVLLKCSLVAVGAASTCVNENVHGAFFTENVTARLRPGPRPIVPLAHKAVEAHDKGYISTYNTTIRCQWCHSTAGSCQCRLKRDPAVCESSTKNENFILNYCVNYYQVQYVDVIQVRACCFQVKLTAFHVFMQYCASLRAPAGRPQAEKNGSF